MRVISALFTACIVLTGCATQDQRETTSLVCPQNMAELDVLKTESQVAKCLGESNHTTSKPDGRHTRLYRYDGGIVVVFLFDKNGEVIRHRVYKDNLAE